jgi:MFS family permease
MGPLIVTETFYKHQLGRAMVTYISFLASGPVLGPFFAGIIVTHLHSWRWFFWIMAPIIGVNLVCAFFLLPETSFAGEWERNDSSVDDLEQKQKNVPSTGHAEDTNSGPDYELSQSKLQLWKDRCFFLPWKMSDITRPKNARFGIVSLLIAPFPMLLIPSVLITALLYGLTIACTVIIAILIANILGPPPHLWSPQSIGFLFISSLIGMIIGFPVGGLVADKLTQRQTRRSNGHYNPRSRLPLIILGSLISPIGLIVIGYYLRPDHFSWVGFAVGFGMVSFGLTGSTNIAATYCLDTFQNKAGVIGVLLNVFKNGIGFGVSYATVPWFNKQGPVKLFGTLAGLLWALYLAMVPIYIYHRQLTEFSERIIAKLGG